MKYYIIAGEASGDLHGSNLMKSLYIEDPNAEIRLVDGEYFSWYGSRLLGAPKYFNQLLSYF